MGPLTELDPGNLYRLYPPLSGLMNVKKFIFIPLLAPQNSILNFLKKS